VTSHPPDPGTNRADPEDRTTSASSQAASHPQPGSNEADPEKESTPAGVAGDLEEMADDVGASTEPDSDDSK